MFLPVNREEMHKLGWEELDIVLVTGDAYIDHPSFGIALIGKYLVSKGYKVGVIARPDINNDDSFLQLPRPKLFFGISSGNVDSMINNYTAMKKVRNDDVYAEKGCKVKRPDRAVIAYTSKIKQLYKGAITLLGGVEASLRRFPHYDYWQNKVRNSILFDSKADYLIYGQGEKAILEFAEYIRKGENENIKRIRNLAYIENKGFTPNDDYNFIELKEFEKLVSDKIAYNEFIKTVHLNANPYLNTGFKLKFQGRSLIVNPPQYPVSMNEMDSYYDIDYERKPHPVYKEKIPAFDMIKDSVTIHRGCFGGCSFCAIGEHQGKFIQSRSEKSILTEIKAIKSKTVTDLGGPSANMYDMKGRELDKCKTCRRSSCVFPKICSNLNTSHKHILNLYENASKIKKVFINSGIRHELALEYPEYIRELALKYVSGLLKIAPEHTQKEVLDLMYKPEISKFEEFKRIFEKASLKQQFVLPYLISSFPGCTIDEMKKMMDYLMKNRIRIEQVQDFIPSPLIIASAMYYTEVNPINGKSIYIPKDEIERKLHRSMMQYFKPENRRLLIKKGIL